MKDALAIHRLLLERQTPHEIVRLPRPIMCADELPEVLGLPPSRCLCTRLYAPCAPGRPHIDGRPGHHHLIAVIATAGSAPVPELVAEVLGLPTVRLAPADLINEDTDYAADLVAPLLLPSDLTTLIGDDVTRADDVVYTATGEPCTALGIHTPDLIALCTSEPAAIRCDGQIDSHYPVDQ